MDWCLTRSSFTCPANKRAVPIFFLLLLFSSEFISCHHMGNSCPFPKYQYPFYPPVSLCWSEYLRQCGFERRKQIGELFEQSYKGKVVEWEGVVTSVSKTQAKFLMNPSEAEITNSELTLAFPAHINQGVPPLFELNKVTKFRGKILSLGLMFQYHISFLIPTSLPFRRTWQPPARVGSQR